MQFNVDIDSPEAVAGWLAPTRPDTPARIVITSAGGAPITLTSNVPRPDIMALGMHATGDVGFLVAPEVVPGLTSMEKLELHDADTGLLIYRSPRPDTDLERKLVRFTQGYGVQSSLDRALERHFNLTYDNCGEYPFATQFGLFNNQICKSIYASGALSYNRQFGVISELGFTTAMLLKEPVMALAETLLALRKRFRSAPPSSDSAAQYLEPFAEWFQDARKDVLDDQDWLERTFAELSDQQRTLLNNPAVRLLACGEEPPEHRHIATALERLATIHVVGVESAFDDFQETLAEAIGMDLIEGFTPDPDDSIFNLYGRLSQIPAATGLLVLDTNLYRLVEGAIAQALR